MTEKASLHIKLSEPRLRARSLQTSQHCEHREISVRPRSLFEPTAADNLLTPDQARALAQRVLAMAKADETRVGISSDWSGNTRFAGGEITT